jgi:F0F1-type ATP synthase assembly protein I
MKNFLRYINLGLTVFSSAVIGLLIGTLADKAMNRFPLFTVMMLFLGILAGIWGMYKSVRELM